MRVFVLTLMWTAVAFGGGRQVGVVMDTSGSMNQNDPPRYAIQITKILSDLLDDDDQLTVARLPVVRGFEAQTMRENCAEPARANIAMVLSGDRVAFKQHVDEMAAYNTQINIFAAATHTAMDAIKDPHKKRMLLFIADADGFNQCQSELEGELVALRQTGVYVASINLKEVGKFGNNPAIQDAELARNSEELVKALAKIYQRFLGSRQVQTGVVQRRVEVKVDEYVRSAFLVVASDGEIPSLDADRSNPQADSIDTNYRGGGSTRGGAGDGRVRSYRIVKLNNPRGGTYVFNAPNLSGGYMLLQDYAVSLRLVGTPTVASGVPATLEFEAYDERTGARITDPALLSTLSFEADIDGQKQTVRSTGGTFRIENTFPTAGKHTINGSLRGESLDRAVSMDVNVREGGLLLKLTSETRVEAGRPTTLQVRAEPFGRGVDSRYPQKLKAVFASGETLELTSTAQGTYTGTWTPTRSGAITARLAAVGGSRTDPVDVTFDVLGRFDWGPLQPVRLGPVKSNSQADSALDLSGSTLYGDVRLSVMTKWHRRRARLELETPSGWKSLGGPPVEMTLTSATPKRFRVRLLTKECPDACKFDEPNTLTLSVPTANGSDRREVPLQIEVVPDSFLVCWWREIVAGIALIFAGIVAYGFIKPSRFQSRMAIEISPEEDLTVGAWYPLKSLRSAQIGLYRDARVFVNQSYMVSGKAAGAVARIRAEGKQIKIRPQNGSSVWRQKVDGEWEMLGAEEETMRPGTLYRNDEKTLFFDVRAR